jgi:hypothetical protein
VYLYQNRGAYLFFCSLFNNAASSSDYIAGLSNYGPPYTFIRPANKVNKCFKKLYKKILIVLFKCLLALTSVKKHFLKWNMSSLRIQEVSVWYAPKVNFNGSKYKAWTTATQDSSRKASVPQLSLRFVCRPDHARILQTLRSFTIVFLNDTNSISLMWVACYKFVIMIHVFKKFLPAIQTEFTKVTRTDDHFQDIVYLFITHLCNHMFGS